MPMTDEQEQEILNTLEDRAWKELEIHKSSPHRVTWAGVIDDLTVIDLCQRVRSGYQVGDVDWPVLPDEKLDKGTAFFEGTSGILIHPLEPDFIKEELEELGEEPHGNS